MSIDISRGPVEVTVQLRDGYRVFRVYTDRQLGRRGDRVSFIEQAPARLPDTSEPAVHDASPITGSVQGPAAEAGERGQGSGVSAGAPQVLDLMQALKDSLR